MAILSSFPSGAGGGDTLSFTNIVVSASDWDDSSYSRSFPYEAVISLSGVTENYFPIVTFYEADDAVYHFMDIAQTGNGTLTIYAQVAPTTAIIIPSVACREMNVFDSGFYIGTLEETEWENISAVAQMGEAGNFWSVGDTKSVDLDGTVGTLNIETTLNVYIIGINHMDINGITFQCFRASNGNDVALVDSRYQGSYTSGICFNINHWGVSGMIRDNTAHGGWKGSDIRYDVLGSTDTPPSGYGAEPTTSRVGYDASSTTAVDPVENTLMSCLPYNLRSVMKPMTIYTSNASDDSQHNIESSVTTSIDYLPLIAEYEVFGVRHRANEYEQDHQEQYDYYSNGGSVSKYNYSNTNVEVFWWLRSPDYGTTELWVGCGHFPYSDDDFFNDNTRVCCGIAPIFLV